MAQRKLTREEMQAALDAWIRAGQNKQRAAMAMRLPNSTFDNRLKQALAEKLAPSPGVVAERQPEDTTARQQAQDALDACAMHPTKAAAADALKLSRSTLDSRVKQARRMGLTPSAAAVMAAQRGQEAVAPPDEPQEPLAERERRRFTDKIRALQAQLQDAHREINDAEDFRRVVFGLQEQDLTPPPWVVDTRPASGTPGVPILFCSDFQWGERISREELDGINEFNLQVAERRYRTLIERTIDLCFNHMVRPQYPGIIKLLGGDMISGDIHQELRETNEAHAIVALVDLAEKLAWGIGQLADRFGRVWCIVIPGNHGRTTEKPQAKQYVQRNYEYLLSVLLEAKFAGDDRVKFWTPLSGDALFQCAGYSFLLTHGDRIGSRGGQGFIGPAATIARGMKKLVDYYNALGKIVDYVLVGHFHTRLELEYGFANGSLPGYSEYAKHFRPRPAPPEQWLLFVHPSWGVTSRWPILLEKRPRLPSKAIKAFEALEPA